MPSERMVETPWGRFPGCPDCGIVSLSGKPVLCEHGVVPATTVEFSFDICVEDDELYRMLVGDTLLYRDPEIRWRVGEDA